MCYFFDEFDTIGKERGDLKETGEIKRVVSSLLLQMDRLPSYVVVISASNHSELLDRAVWRRFQIQLVLSSPTKSQITDFMQKLKKRTNINFDHNDNLIDKFIGCSYSEIETFYIEALRRAILAHNPNNAKNIIIEKLKQWQLRLSANKSKKEI